MTNAEINAAISGWFEPKPDDSFEEEKCYSSKFFWTRENAYHEVRPWTSNYDYFTSEDANARLLDAMPEPQLWIESDKGEPKLWGCSADLQDERSGYFTALDEDRKTAIVLAFCAFAGIAHKRDGGEGA